MKRLVLLAVLIPGVGRQCQGSPATLWPRDARLGQGRARREWRHVDVGIGEDYPKESRSLSAAKRDLEAMSTNGVKVIRISFSWADMEPSPGQFDWSFWDEYVPLATRQFGMRLVPYLCYTPYWAAVASGPEHSMQPPKDNGAFADFVRALVSRYRDSIHSWEIWNEPDNPEYWTGSAAQFSELLRAGSRAVKEADPRAQVVMGGLAWNLKFLDQVAACRGALDDVDVVNLHNYAETWANDPLERIPELVGRAEAVLQKYHEGRPLWMAEVGYSSFRTNDFVSKLYQARHAYEHTPLFQAESLTRTLTLLMSSPAVSLVTWYRINDLAETVKIIGDVNNRHLGLLDVHGRAKPALRSLGFFESMFAGGFQSLDHEVSVGKAIDSPAEVHAFEVRPQKTVVVAWLREVTFTASIEDRSDLSPTGRLRSPNPEEATRGEQIELRLPFKGRRAARVFDELGNERGRIAFEEEAPSSKGERMKMNLRGGEVQIVIID
jgi:hypothetical protein